MSYPLFSAAPERELSLDVRSNHVLVGNAWQARSRKQTGATAALIRYRYAQADQSERKTLSDFFDGRQGRTLPFWLPSHRKDFVLSAGASAGAAYIDVVNQNHEGALDGLKRWILIPEHVAGGDYLYGISSVTDLGATERLTLDHVLAADVPQTSRIQVAYFVRFEADVLAFSPVAGTRSECEIAFRELQEETPSV